MSIHSCPGLGSVWGWQGYTLKVPGKEHSVSRCSYHWATPAMAGEPFISRPMRHYYPAPAMVSLLLSAAQVFWGHAQCPRGKSRCLPLPARAPCVIRNVLHTLCCCCSVLTRPLGCPGMTALFIYWEKKELGTFLRHPSPPEKAELPRGSDASPLTKCLPSLCRPPSYFF